MPHHLKTYYLCLSCFPRHRDRLAVSHPYYVASSPLPLEASVTQASCIYVGGDSIGPAPASPLRIPHPCTLMCNEWTAAPFRLPPRLCWELMSCFFKKINYFNWRQITLQNCSDFCRTLTWISHGCTCVPHPEPPPPTSLRIPSLRVIPVLWPWAPCLTHRTWTGDLSHIW